MNHKKLVINENGDKVMITVYFWINGNRPSYDIDLFICKKGKRKFSTILFDDFEYRELSLKERNSFRNKKYLEYVTNENILEVKNELYKLLSPIYESKNQI